MVSYNLLVSIFPLLDKKANKDFLIRQGSRNLNSVFARSQVGLKAVLLLNPKLLILTSSLLSLVLVLNNSLSLLQTRKQQSRMRMRMRMRIVSLLKRRRRMIVMRMISPLLIPFFLRVMLMTMLMILTTSLTHSPLSILSLQTASC